MRHISTVLLALMLCLPGLGCRGTLIVKNPPPRKIHRPPGHHVKEPVHRARPHRPSAHHHWVKGHYKGRGHHRVWIAGHWLR